MKIALIGYGKMGRMIEKIAQERGLTVTCRIDKDNIEDFGTDAFRNSDVAIEFSVPSTAFGNISRCMEAGIPVVSGTTGWVNRREGGRTLLEIMRGRCDGGEGSLLWASNFSIGVNVFAALNRYLANIMDKLPQYTPYMTETHHIHKLDHPSGTALTLASGIEAETGRISGWSEEPAEGKLTISHIREGEVPGIHTVKWDSPVDEISITHSAKSRGGFASGAVVAAEWLATAPRGFHTIDELMDKLLKK